MFKFFLSFLFALIGFIVSDIIHFVYLKYLKKDKDILNVKYGLNWWYSYYSNKY